MQVTRVEKPVTTFIPFDLTISIETELEQTMLEALFARDAAVPEMLITQYGHSTKNADLLSRLMGRLHEMMRS